MTKYKTELSKKTIKALAKYHVQNSGQIKKKQVWGYVGAILVLCYSLVNAYGLYLKYEGAPIFLLKSSVYLFITFLLFFTTAKGSQRNLERELKQYFSQTKTTYLEYTISKEGIQMIATGHTTMYEWAEIERIKSDNTYYYFTSRGKHSIIAKELISGKDRKLMEDMMESINKDYLEANA